MRLTTARSANFLALESSRRISEAQLSQIMLDLRMLLAKEYQRGERFGAARTIRAIGARSRGHNKLYIVPDIEK
jgi:hypothetical protein